MSCGAEVEALKLMTDLTKDTDFTIPAVDFDDPLLNIPGDLTGEMYKELKPIDISELTEGKVGGSGAFDILMTSVSNLLKVEYEKGRITGSEYTRAYIELVQGAMQTANQFVLTKDQAFWAAQNAQIAAIQARVAVLNAKVQIAAVQFEAMNQKANYGLTSMKLASESMSYCVTKYQLEYTMPEQLQLLQFQREGQAIENQTATYTLSYVLPEQVKTASAQRTGIDIENQTKLYTQQNILPLDMEIKTLQKVTVDYQNRTALYQLNYMLPNQLELVKEQLQTARSETLDYRTDGSKIFGVKGSQRELYAQQIVSYRKDAELKAAKMFADAWTVQKTIDEGTPPPNGFTNASLDGVLNTIKSSNGLG